MTSCNPLIRLVMLTSHPDGPETVIKCYCTEESHNALTVHRGHSLQGSDGGGFPLPCDSFASAQRWGTDSPDLQHVSVKQAGISAEGEKEPMEYLF